MIPARARPAVRPPGLPVRRSRIRRASAGLSPVRAGAAFVLLVSALAVYGVGASSAFVYRQLAFEPGPLSYTSHDVVLTTLGLDGAAPNLFLLRTDALAERLLSLPAVTGAVVSVGLPDRIEVRLVEREPILVWNVSGHRFLVDRTGFLFASGAPGGPGDQLPSITDHRAASGTFDVGAQLDPVDLDAATRLASLAPKDVGSAAAELRVTIEDGDGFELRPVGVPWIALFGIYTQSLRAPDLIPGQVRLLRSLLAGRELSVKRVTLADDRNGTYVSR
jgi:cell division septal protein FtsQ